MNKAITDGFDLMPLPFAAGLDVWSCGDGTPASDSYATNGSALLVLADADFGSCLEITKDDTVTRLRFMGETPILPGCYLRVRARIKAVAGAFPSVRIAGYAGAFGGGAATGFGLSGPSVSLATYGDVVEVSAIIGTGVRTGVDLVWTGAAFGHFGLDLTGANGGIVRIDDLVIEDITSVFQRDMMAMVDVRDFGALGDGTTDDSDAFRAADMAANGREVLVSKGVYQLDQDVTLTSRVRFEGTVCQGAEHRFTLLQDYDFTAYVDAFGDDVVAFQKAYQALGHGDGPTRLDLGGRCIEVREPLSLGGFSDARCMVRNGHFKALASAAWDVQVAASQASYAPSAPLQLSNVVNVTDVAVGALVEGSGVGREVYVTSSDVAARTLAISQPLFDAAGTRTFSFKRFAYVFDFSATDAVDHLTLADIEFQCDGVASAVCLAPKGEGLALRDCSILQPKDRGITSIGRGCQGLVMDRCAFVSVPDRAGIAFNVNSEGAALRDNQIDGFKRSCVIAGTGAVLSGNRWARSGIVLTSAQCNSVISGNQLRDSAIEWTNEHSEKPVLDDALSFGGLTVSGNIFTATDVPEWFNFFVVKPYGAGHFIDGLALVSNVFCLKGSAIDRVEHVDTTFAELNFSHMRQIDVSANTFCGVSEPVMNPAFVTHDQDTVSPIWVADSEPHLPFKGRARFVDSICADGPIQDAGGADVFGMPWVDSGYSADERQVRFVWDRAVTGKLRFQVRMDDPQ